MLDIFTVVVVAMIGLTIAGVAFPRRFTPKRTVIRIRVRSTVTHQRIAQIQESAHWHRRDANAAESVGDSARAAWNYERMHALAGETIELLGYHDDGSDESDICRDMVFYGVSQEETVEKLMRLKM